MPDEPDFDTIGGIAACGGNADLHRQVTNMLAADLVLRLDALHRAITAGDLDGAARLAHKHKGACLAVGALRLAHAFASLDQAGRARDAALVTERMATVVTVAEAFRLAAARTV